jgi:chemotaxis methyl-accepting protein methylase
MVHEMAKRLNGNDARQANLVAASANDVADDTLVESEVDPEFPSDSNFPMVGIVASAGGLDALKHFFAAMPSTSGMAFVLVPHLDAKHKSLMVELLARQTSMPVVEAIEGMRVEANSVYIIPPNHCLRLSDGYLRLSQLPDPIGAQTAIDFFLRSLAVDQQEQAIGIVLSGTGSHGTLGIREIKRCGGMVMAQSPESAEFDQMPRSAIETGLVDFVLPPNAMPDALLTYSKQPYLNRDHPIATSADFDEQLKIVLEVMRSQTKYDFRSYRTNMIRRRILRRMGLAHVDDLSKYIEFLQSNPDEMDALSKDFLIGVTAFFREHEAFAFLEKELFPIVVAKQRHETPLRIWVPSCATGEEAYSIAILLLEAFAEAGKPANVQIFASDLNQQSIDIARRGVYLASIAVDVSPERLKHFFVTSDAIHYQVTKQVRDLIVYSTQNIICDAPFSKLDLISCRNFLIYLEPEIQQKLISLFHFALVENGHLLLGPAETVGRATNLFEPVSKKWRVYRRIGPSRRGNISLPVDKLDELQRTKPLEAVPPPPSRRYKELTESTLREYSPAAVLINRRYEVLYVTGSVVDYLEFPTGELSKDLLAMARAGLRTRLRAACHKAITERITVVDKEARVQRKETYIACTITARPLADSNSSEGLVLVMLQDHPLGQATNGSATANNPSVATNDGENDQIKLVQLLEYELKSTREELQSTIEEMESANEELQSSNEELESSKEELQSLNEELSTVNCQLLEKVNELDKSNSEITNLMASTEIATLYLDAQLRIKRFTDPTVAIANHPVSAEPRLENPASELRSSGFSRSMKGKSIATKTDADGKYRIGPLPRQVEIGMWCDATRPAEQNDREYLGNYFIELEEQRPPQVHRLGPEPSSPSKKTVEERVAELLRDARLGGFHAMIILADTANERCNSFVQENLLNYDANIQVSNYMQMRFNTGASATERGKAFVKAKNWPVPTDGSVVAIALDASGKELGQTTIDVSAGDANDQAARFVEKHSPAVVDARLKWAEAFELAKKTNRRVWVRISQRYCGPFFQLNNWLDDHRTMLEKEFVLLKIDDVRDKNGVEVAKELTGDKPYGIPFFAFYGADQNMLIDSIGPTGNIGSISGYEGKRHFRRMLKKVRQSLSDAEIEQLVGSIED